MDRSFSTRIGGGLGARGVSCLRMQAMPVPGQAQVCTCGGMSGAWAAAKRARPAPPPEAFIRPKVRLARASGGADAPRLRRNNTSYPVRVTAMLRALHGRYTALLAGPASEEQRWAALLKYYQYYVRAVMTNPEFGIGKEGNARGMLIYHLMGMGKTRLAVAVAMSLWDTRAPVIMLPRSLQKNFINEVNAALVALNPSAPPETIARLQEAARVRFQFISMDAYNMADQVTRIGQPKVKGRKGAQDAPGGFSPELLGGPGSLDGKLLIVDEAHNLFRAIINSGNENTNARRLYDMVQEAKDLRIIFLTGTPASKDPFELVPCFNMLAGRDLLPPQYETFVRLYVDKENKCVKNRERLANRLFGLVSHVAPSLPIEPTSETTGAASAPKKPRADGGFPEQLPLIIERVEMAPDQYRQYLLAREKEETEGKGGEGGVRGESIAASPPLSLPGSEKKAMRSYYVKSRALSNFAAAREWAGVSVERMPPQAFTEASTPKIARMVVKRIKVSMGPVLVYSQFVDAGGLKVVGRFLQNEGYEEFSIPGVKSGAEEKEEKSQPEEKEKKGERPDGKEDPVDVKGMLSPKPRYAIISGEVDSAVRDLLQKVFNSHANAHGEIIRALLVSKTGAEGLDLKYIRQIHKLEPYWDKAREDQVDARGVRLGSHDFLPVEEREVQPYLYIATANIAMRENMPEQNREEKTIDEIFHERALTRYALNLDFRKLLKSVSIECSLLEYGNCRVCVPTESVLYHDDFNQDIRLPDPCEAMAPKSVAAKKLEIAQKDGSRAQYFYIEDSSDLLGYQFFEYRKDLGGHAPVDPSDPVIPELLRALDAKINT